MSSSSERGERGAAVRTFLIADIRGYTRFTAQHGDEAASRLAARFAQVAAEGIEAWGGELVELRGDEALAVFGSARSALRAAVELQSAFADETRVDPSLPLSVGIGLDAGEAVPVGDGYRGAALNLASRLCSLAAAGEVLASESLIHLAGQVDGLDVAPSEPAAVKGYDEPVAASRVSARAIDDPVAPLTLGVPVGPLPTLPPELDAIVPMVGRESELRWLRWQWRRAGAGHGRTVVLSGPPGIGKTRLAAAIAAIAHEGGADISYLPASRLAMDAPAALADAAVRPRLIVVDDLDAAAADAARDLAERSAALAGRACLLLVTHRREAPPQLIALIERIAPAEQRHTVGPLDAGAVRSIVAMYGGQAAADAPVAELLTESGGVPAAVHRLASAWARGSAARRLGSSADRTAAGRRGLRDAEAALVQDVADLELARERGSLYGLDTADAEADTAAASRTVCPYKGLAEFEAADADHYFGRERLVAELIARSVGSTFLGLVGDSGSGKSSALRAGLLPALAGGVLPGSGSWPQALLRPGEQPVAELGRALARALPDLELPADDTPAALDAALAWLAAGQRLVVVVDQFEEVFNATRDDAARSAFIGLLTRERPGLKVVLAMRADHYGRCAAYPALARLLGSSQVLVGPLSAAELAAVIEHPAQRVGLRVEPALTAALVADAGGEPGVLPLLSTALLELWGAREGNRLTLSAYRASGGLQGSIARLAEATYASLDPHRQDIARSLLLRLAGPGEGSEMVRRRVPLDELDTDDDPVTGEVLATLTSARLLTAGDGHVEVAHEALLREWPRLQGWLADDAAGRAVRLHLIGAARDWAARGREPGDLYRGARLAAALDWAAEHPLDLNASERSFLDESRAASERDVERQRRTNRRLRILLTGAAVLLVVAVGAGGYAFLQARRAEDQTRTATEQRQVAEQATTTADAQRLGAQALVTGTDLDLSMLLARQGVALDDSAATRTNLASVLDRSPAAIAVGRPLGETRLTVLEVSEDGSALLVGVDPSAAVVDSATGRVRFSYDGQEGDKRVGMAADGRLAVLSKVAGQKVLKFLDGDTGATLGGFAFPPQSSAVVSYSPDLATAYGVSSDNNTLTAFDVATSQPVRVLESPSGTGIMEVVGLPGGHLITLLANDDGSPAGGLALWGPTGDTPSSSIDLPDWKANGFAWSGDMQSMAIDALPGPGQVSIVSLTDATMPVRTVLQTNSNGAFALSPDGTLLITGNADGSTRVWDIASGQPLETMVGHTTEVNQVAVSERDGQLTAWTTSLDGTVIGFDLSGHRRVAQPFTGASDFPPDAAPQAAPGPSVAFSPDGRMVALAHVGGAGIFDASTHALITQLSTVEPDSQPTLAWSSDGSRLAVAGNGAGIAELFDTATWKSVRGPLPGPLTDRAPWPWEVPDPAPTQSSRLPNLARAVAFSPDSRTVTVGTEDGRLWTWDSATGEPTGDSAQSSGPIRDLAFDPVTGVLAAAVDPDTGGIAVVLAPHETTPSFTVGVDDGDGPAGAVAFSPDGTLLATGGGTGDVRFWDPRTGAELGTRVPAVAGYVLDLGWTPDGRTLVSSGTDGNVQLIDAQARATSGVMPSVRGGEWVRAAVSPDGQRVIASYANGDAVDWSISPADWSAQACRIAGRTLTADEWAKYLPGRPYAPACGP